ncbi:MAG TPA: FprA family A-type flavoprotein [Anaerolineae bacterium]|nr:FprA family A-type flavoprotein [Anaerolineae bacterium]
MTVVGIRPEVYWIGVNDRTTDLFEGLWPISQEGVAYNSYLITDEKTALIDLTKAFKSDEFFDQIGEVLDISQLDYVIINHIEPDHTGVLNTVRRIAPDVTFLGSAKTQELLASFYGFTENVQVVNDGDTLSLGRRTLQFVSTPFVHWPETMMTYDATDRILFSCDAFGGYGAMRGGIFDDQSRDLGFYQREALRYYVNIIARFSKRVLMAIDKLADVPVDIIAPSHGLIWRQHPQLIVNLYRKWAEYADNGGDPGVTLIYGSMYGYTEKMMNAVAQGISREGVPLKVFDAARTHVSYILPSLWTNQGVMIGAPTYEVSLFPPVAQALDVAVHKQVRFKKVARFGSYGWSGGAQKHFERIIAPAHWDLVDSFEFVGSPRQDELKEGEEFGARFANLIKEAAG